MKTRAAVAAVIILLSCAPQAALAQRRPSTSEQLRELREEVRRLREEQDGMRKELQEIRRLLEQARGPAAPEFVSVDDDPFQGSADARVVIIDFSDYQ
jgi:septal ring factor EnvC (AmiA/AmiB activator)